MTLLDLHHHDGSIGNRLIALNTDMGSVNINLLNIVFNDTTSSFENGIKSAHTIRGVRLKNRGTIHSTGVIIFKYAFKDLIEYP